MLQFIASVLIVGIALGYALGGRIGTLASISIRPWVLAATWGAVAVQVVGSHARSVLGIDAGLLALAVSYSLIGALLAPLMIAIFRRHVEMMRVGICLVCCGWLANATVIALNGAMPVSHAALERSGRSDAAAASSRSGIDKTKLASRETRLAFLGDVVPVPVLRVPLSPGDIALGLGCALLIASAMSQQVPASRKVAAAN